MFYYPYQKSIYYLKTVDNLLKVIVNKGRKFANNFNKFYEIEIQKNESLYPDDEKGLYDDFIRKLITK